MNQSLLSVNNMVSVENGEVVATTYQVAKFFGKLHKDVLRAIRNLDCSDGFRERNFTLCFENSDLQNGKPNSFYQMTKNGFMFLVMGFTGRKAAQLKEAYINAFDWMYQQLTTGKDALIRELQETIKLERISFQNGSNAGKELYKRKVEKKKIRERLKLIEEKLGQPDLLLEAGLC